MLTFKTSVVVDWMCDQAHQFRLQSFRWVRLMVECKDIDSYYRSSLLFFPLSHFGCFQIHPVTAGEVTHNRKKIFHFYSPQHNMFRTYIVKRWMANPKRSSKKKTRIYGQFTFVFMYVNLLAINRNWIMLAMSCRKTAYELFSRVMAQSLAPFFSFSFC